MAPAEKLCWGKQYDDSDDECQNCELNKSCKPETINNASRRSAPIQPQQYSLPVIPQQNYASRFKSPTVPQVPIPPPLMPPQVPQQQASAYPTRSVFPSMAPQTSVGYQSHAPAGWNTPIAYLPRPNPANPAWWQYQGETTGTRLGKNMLLSALQAIFSELLRFFSNWTWPARLGTT